MPDIIPDTLVRPHLENLVELLERDIVERALIILAGRGEFCFRNEEVDEDKGEGAEAGEDAEES